jgi:hypothetical protein
VVFSGWPDGPDPILVQSRSPGAVYTMSFATEYKLTRSVSDRFVSGADGFHAAGPRTACGDPQRATVCGGAGQSPIGEPGVVVMNGPSPCGDFTVAPASVRIV